MIVSTGSSPLWYCVSVLEGAIGGGRENERQDEKERRS